MSKDKKENKEVFTYRVTPSGDGRYFVWRKYDLEGAEVEVGQQLFNSEADAEKVVRSLIQGDDVLAVSTLKSVDASDNNHVVLETGAVEDATRSGAAIKYAPQSQEGDNDFRPVDDSITPAMKAVSVGQVAPAGGDAARPESEQKAVDKAQEKADKEKADADKEAAKSSK